MKKSILLAVLFSMATMSYAQVSDLVSMLSKEMDITTEQAEGGAGSLFNLAKDNMSKSDFSSLSDVVPDMGGLLDAVPALSGKKKSWFSKAAESFTGLPAVKEQFKKLGLKESHVALMTPLVADYVEKKGGAMLAKAFSGSIGL